MAAGLYSALGGFAQGFGQGKNNRTEQDRLKEQQQAEQEKLKQQQDSNQQGVNAVTDQNGEQALDAATSRLEQQQQPQQVQQQSQGGMGGINPGAFSSFMGGGSSTGAGTGAGSGTGIASAGGGTAGAGSSAGGSSSAGAWGAAGWWALLAAAIYTNEKEARDHGYRSKDDKQYAKDLISGKVLDQDVEQRWSPKLFGKDDKYGFGGDAQIGTNVATGRFAPAWKKLESGTVGKAIKKIF